MRRTVTFVLMVLVAGAWIADAAWTDSFKLSGDFRYRHEQIDKEGKDTRDRQRLRARLAVKAKANDHLDFNLRIASGSSDPVSTNTTLDSSFSSKGIYLDRAYFDWHPGDLGLSIMGGKVKNPFHSAGDAGLIWDGDLNPEGLGLTFSTSDAVAFFAGAGYFWVEERSSDDDSMLFGAQAGVKAKLGDVGKLTAGASFFTYTECKGYSSFVEEGEGFGNTLDDEGLYMYDYDELEGFFELALKAGPIPLAFFADYVVNGDADEEDTAYVAGFKVGKKKDPGSWELAYDYRHVEADAVLAAFADSDFGGGGTDAEGHKLGASVRVMKSTDLALTYFMNTLGVADGATELDYDRLQVDFKFKF